MTDFDTLAANAAAMLKQDRQRCDELLAEYRKECCPVDALEAYPDYAAENRQGWEQL